MVEPPTVLFSALAMSEEVMPSWRALSCSTSTLSTRCGSFQSKVGAASFGLAEITPANCCASSRTVWISGPPTRYCTGLPTGGPSSSNLTKASVPTNSSRSSFSSAGFTRLRASMFLVTMTVCPK